MKPEQKYVVGFMFDESMNNVALIRKNKPAWQAGLLNGIGGKIEDGETPTAAMVREFKEEAGWISIQPWKHFCSMSGVNNDGGTFEVEFFYVVGKPHQLTSQEMEQIEVKPSADIAAGKEKTIGNLPWLVALALDCGKGAYPPIRVTASYSASGEQTEGEYAEKRARGSLERMVCTKCDQWIIKGQICTDATLTQHENCDNPWPKSVPSEPDGIKWKSANGVELLLITAGNHKGWVCKRHPDGHWVTDQKPSEQERTALLDKLHALRHG